MLPQVEEAVGAERTEPALRAYLKQLRMEAYIDYKPGYVDTAAVVNPSKPSYSAYTPPAPKKKKKVEKDALPPADLRLGSTKQQASAPAPATGSAPAAARLTSRRWPRRPERPPLPADARPASAATANDC